MDSAWGNHARALPAKRKKKGIDPENQGALGVSREKSGEQQRACGLTGTAVLLLYSVVRVSPEHHNSGRCQIRALPQFFSSPRLPLFLSPPPSFHLFNMRHP